MSAAREIGAPRLEDTSWMVVCPLDAIPPGTGAAALVRGEQIAIVRACDGTVYALSHFDPFSKAFVLGRGIVGDRAGVPKIASPIYKQNFDLRTGQCLDDPEVCVPVFPVRVVAGHIELCLNVAPLRTKRATAGPKRAAGAP